jgi:hypothetical protein
LVEFALEEPKFPKSSQFLSYKNREILPGKKSTAAHPLPFMEDCHVAPPGNCSPQTMFLGEQPNHVPPKSNHAPWGANVFEILYDHNFCI